MALTTHPPSSALWAYIAWSRVDVTLPLNLWTVNVIYSSTAIIVQQCKRQCTAVRSLHCTTAQETAHGRSFLTLYNSARDGALTFVPYTVQQRKRWRTAICSLHCTTAQETVHGHLFLTLYNSARDSARPFVPYTVQQRKRRRTAVRSLHCTSQNNLVTS